MLAHAGSIAEADRGLRARLPDGAIEAAIALVPAEWFTGDPPEAYAEYLHLRLAAGGFVTEAEEARAHVRGSP